jgi:hypothetical protein
LSFGIVSCGGSEKPAPEKPPVAEVEQKPAPPAGENKKKLSIPERLAALKELGRKFESLPGKDFEADNQAMLTWIQGRPEYEASGISKSGSVWARFTDGRVVGLLRSRDAKGRPIRGSSGGGASIMDKATCGFAKADQKSKFMLPSSRQVRILNHPDMLDRFGTRVLPSQAAQWFEAAGYTLAHGDASVEGLKKTRGDGIFCYDTHGGYFPVNGQGPDVVNFASATRVDAEHDSLYADDHHEGRIVHCYIHISGTGSETGWYGITPAFVTKYMSFADNAFVFLNACHSAADHTMCNAFFEKRASVYAGWTDVVNGPSAYQASTFLFDRLLAANFYVPEAPKQRPFDFGAVYGDMRRRNYDTNLLGLLSDAESSPHEHFDPAAPDHPPASQLKREPDASSLVIHHKSGHTFAGLRPSIGQMTVFEDKDELHLLGYFGGKQGKVKINGHSVTVKSWEASTVKLALPSSGPGSAGPVVVEVDGRHSNTVPLTEWRGQFRYTQEDNSHGPSLKRRATFDLHFRADVHQFRRIPHETPHPRGKSTSRGVANFFSAKDSKVKWGFSGQAIDRNKNTYELKGSGSITGTESFAGVKDVKDGPFFHFMGDLDAEQKVVYKANLFAGGRYGTQTFTSSVNGKSSDSPAFMVGMPDIGTLKFDGKFTIEAGKVELTQGKIVSKLEWDAIPAKHLPGAETLAAAPDSNTEKDLVTQIAPRCPELRPHRKGESHVLEFLADKNLSRSTGPPATQAAIVSAQTVSSMAGAI